MPWQRVAVLKLAVRGRSVRAKEVSEADST